MYYLQDHLLPGSFRPSYADTDSICLGLSRTSPIPPKASPEEYYRCLFDPLVKPDMRESWESSWKDWFVTTNTVQDQRKPGKLKSKFILRSFCLTCNQLTNTNFQKNSASVKGILLHCLRNATILLMQIQAK